MRFTPKEDFKHGHITFEAGNTYSSEKYGLSDEDVKAFHRNGWAEVEGMDAAPERETKGAVVRPQNGRHGHKAQEA